MIDNPYTGLFTRLARAPSRAGDPDVSVWSATASSGAGWDDRAARDACIGEGIERFDTAPLPQDDAIEASFDELDEPAVEPERWVLFHPEQHAQSGFPFRPFTRSTRTRWTRFRRGSSGETCLVPAEMAYLYLPEHRICPGVSTGLAAGRHGDPVLLRALQEVIERDAVMGAWWGGYPIEECSVELPEAARRPNLRYRFFRVGSPYSPHVTIVTVEDGARFAVGSACRETRTASWNKSLLEAIHGRMYVRFLLEQGGPRNEFAEHAVYYTLHPERLRETVFSTHESTRLIRVSPLPEVYFRNLTPPAVADEWLVLRVVVPGLQPLHGNDRFAHLGGPLWAPRGLAEWSRVPPHPFP